MHIFSWAMGSGPVCWPRGSHSAARPFEGRFPGCGRDTRASATYASGSHTRSPTHLICGVGCHCWLVPAVRRTRLGKPTVAPAKRLWAQTIFAQTRFTKSSPGRIRLFRPVGVASCRTRPRRVGGTPEKQPSMRLPFFGRRHTGQRTALATLAAIPARRQDRLTPRLPPPGSRCASRRTRPRGLAWRPTNAWEKVWEVLAAFPGEIQVECRGSSRTLVGL